jgi:mannose-6-phosphate isomerase
MLSYNYGSANSQILRGEAFPESKFTREYSPPIEEFSILQTSLNKSQTETIKGLEGPSIIIFVEGEGTIKSAADDSSLHCEKGSIFFIGAGVSTTLTGNGVGSLIAYRAFCVL